MPIKHLLLGPAVYHMSVNISYYILPHHLVGNYYGTGAFRLYLN